ncbi:MAG TPA: DUF2278 family protein [Chthoniobacter sp.]|jgi:uncharacterized protein YukJ
MTHTYGFVKCKLVTAPKLQHAKHRRELQYHLHATLSVQNEGKAENWDCAINVGTNDADDLLQYKLAFDYAHPIVATLKAAAPGFSDLTNSTALPALDFLRSDILTGTGPWRPSDVMDGSENPEPVATLARALSKAYSQKYDVYIFGRTYTDGSNGVHDIHMNQGSSGNYINTGGDNDHNDIWQDGAVLIDPGQDSWIAYFTTFTQQTVPTDKLGNAVDGSHGITVKDDGSLVS